MRKVPQFGIADVLLLTAGCAVCFVMTQGFASSRHISHLAHAVFLSATAISTLFALKLLTPGQAFVRGFAAFSWLYLAAAVLIVRNDELAVRSLIGLGGAFVAAVASRWVALLSFEPAVSSEANPLVDSTDAAAGR